MGSNENKKYTNILVWVNKKIKNDILPTKCHLTINEVNLSGFIYIGVILNLFLFYAYFNCFLYG